MAIDSQLWDLYHRWKELTEHEGMAILSSNWSEVRRCQQAKQDLQPEIIRLTGQAKKEMASATAWSTFEDRVRQVVNELILLESRNNSSLQERMEQARRERNELEVTSQRLRQVHRSYAPASGPVWNQYS